MKRLASHRAGLTLVEVLFAFAILTTLLTLAYSSALNAWRTSVSSNQRTQAQYIAQQAVENFKAYLYSPCFKWTRTAAIDPPGFIDTIGDQGGAAGVAAGAGFVVIPYDVMDPLYKVECPWNVVATSAGETANSIGSKDGDIDATPFTFRIRAIEYYGSIAGDPPTAYTQSGAQDSSTRAMGYRVSVDWTNSNGVLSRLEQTTILVKPADGPGVP